MAAPPPYEDYSAPPAFNDLPTYDAGVHSGYSNGGSSSGINLGKKDNDVDLRDTSPPPFEDHNPGYADVPPPAFDGGNRQPQQQQQGYQQTTVVVANSGSSAMLFHLISITCALLSLFIFPLFELIPMIMICFVRDDLKNSRDQMLLHQLDLIITLLVCLIWLILIIIIAVFTFGIGLILLVFIIPFFFVIIALQETMPSNTLY
uniref:Uncharacterized protein n=1 Tax=Vannella robusta TaxID=1487602 RepID=A0A7S4HQV3_9EUKA